MLPRTPRRTTITPETGPQSRLRQRNQAAVRRVNNSITRHAVDSATARQSNPPNRTRPPRPATRTAANPQLALYRANRRYLDLPDIPRPSSNAPWYNWKLYGDRLTTENITYTTSCSTLENSVRTFEKRILISGTR